MFWAGSCGLAYAPARVVAWCAKASLMPLVHVCVCVCVSMFEIYMLYRTCPSWHLHVCLFDSGRFSSGIYTGKKMAAREVGG